MIRFILPVGLFLIVKCTLAEEVTHMPPVADPTIPPDIQKLLTEEYENKDCEEDIKKSILSLRHIESLRRPLNLQIPPCERCSIEGIKDFSVAKRGARVKKYLEDGILIHVLGELKRVKITCNSCSLTDDLQTKVTGSIDLEWTNGLVELLFLKEDEVDIDHITPLLVNATNINQERVKVQCLGEETFQRICTQTHKNGEFDHMFRNTVEKMFTVGEDAILKQWTGSVKDGESVLSSIFCCLVISDMEEI